MKLFKTLFSGTFVTLSAFIFTTSCDREHCNREQFPKEFTISKERLLDKVKGGWAGQALGCTYGGETEFCYLGRIIPDSVTISWSKDLTKHLFLSNPGLYDDIYMDLTFVDVIERTA